MARSAPFTGRLPGHSRAVSATRERPWSCLDLDLVLTPNGSGQTSPSTPAPFERVAAALFGRCHTINDAPFGRSATRATDVTKRKAHDQP